MVQTILPKTDLTYDDIRDTLNANGGTVTNVVETAFKPEANINMWSRMKPVNSKENFPIDDDWWKGDDGRCGINSDNAFETNWRLISNLYSLENNGYTYSKINVPYRVGDFRGYYSGTLLPATNFVVSTKKVGNAEGSILKASYLLTQQYNDNITPGSLSLWDIYIDSSFTLGSGYPGVVVYKGNEAKYIQTNASPTSVNLVIDIEVPTLGWTAGDYVAYPIIATAKVNNSSNVPVGCRFYAIPCVLSDTFLVVSGEATTTYIQLKANWTNHQHGTIKYTIYARLDLSDTKTYDNNVIQFLHGGFHDLISTGDYTVNIPTFSLSKSNSFTEIASGTITKPFLKGDYYVKVFLQDTNGRSYNSGEKEINKVQDMYL